MDKAGKRVFIVFAVLVEVVIFVQSSYKNVKLSCAEGLMTFEINTKEDFNGVIYTRGSFMKTGCSYDAKGGDHFRLDFPLEQCKTKWDAGIYTNVVVVQSDDELIMEGDVAFQIACQYNSNGKAVEYSAKMSGIIQKVIRKKKCDAAKLMNTEMKRCLSTWDVTCFGFGHTIGAGLYVVIGIVAKTKAGPAVGLSYAIAGVAALFSGFSYAELGTRVPQAGSAYAYNVITIGELWGFVVGWNMILENVINVAAVARTFSGYADALDDFAIRNATMSSIDSSGLPLISSYLDFYAGAFVFVTAIFLTVGVKKSSWINSVFSLINVLTVIVVIIVGLFYVDLSNWGASTGGFMPFGFKGVIAGAGQAFFGYVGFETVASAAEEAGDPFKVLPRAIFLVLILATVSYVAIGFVLTLMVPYPQIVNNSSIAAAFRLHGNVPMSYFVTVGAISAMTATSMCSLYAVSRVIYAMAQDGLFFEVFSKIYSSSKIPLLSVILSTVLSMIVTCFLSLEILIEFLSIGTLLAYTMVNVCVIILRYELEEDTPSESTKKSFCLCSSRIGPKYCVKILTTLLILSMLVFIITTARGMHLLVEGTRWAITLSTISGIITLVLLILISTHEQSSLPVPFKVPFVPFLPFCGIFVNLTLMVYLQGMTWLRLLVWQAVGFFV